jgi:hypothetical protein
MLLLKVLRLIAASRPPSPSGDLTPRRGLIYLYLVDYLRGRPLRLRRTHSFSLEALIYGMPL